MENTYTCALCGKTFTGSRSDEEALAELKNEFGPEYDKSNSDVVCDDCYGVFVTWSNLN